MLAGVVVVLLGCGACALRTPGGASRVGQSGAATTPPAPGLPTLSLKSGARVSVADVLPAGDPAYGTTLVIWSSTGLPPALDLATSGHPAVRLVVGGRLPSGLFVCWSPAWITMNSEATLSSSGATSSLQVPAVLGSGHKGLGFGVVATNGRGPSPPLAMEGGILAGSVSIVYGRSPGSVPDGTQLIVRAGEQVIHPVGVVSAGAGRFLAYFPPTAGQPGQSLQYLRHGRLGYAWPF